MDLQQLEYFIALTDTPNFAAASDRLYISRQGLSRSIAMLEKELGHSLFYRTSAGLELTENGRIFQKCALNMLREYQTALHAMRTMDLEGEHSLRFLIPTGFWSNISADMIFSYFEANPGVSHSTIFFSDEELVDVFLRGNYDFAVTTARCRFDELDYHFLFDNYRCITVNRSHPLAQREKIRAADLSGLSVAVASDGAFDYDWMKNYCRRHGIVMNIVPVNDATSVIQYAQSGTATALQVGYLSDPGMTAFDSKALFWAEDELEETLIPVRIVTKKGKPVPPHVQALIDHIAGYCGRLLKEASIYPYRRSGEPH